MSLIKKPQNVKINQNFKGLVTKINVLNKLKTVSSKDIKFKRSESAEHSIDAKFDQFVVHSKRTDP